MVIRLAEELDLTRVSEGPEAVDHLGSIALEHLERGSRNGERHLVRALLRLQLLEQDGVHRKIAFLDGPPDVGPVAEVVIVVGVFPDIEKTVEAEPGRLVHLEVQANALLVHISDS